MSTATFARIVAGIESVAQQGVRLAVLPETATTYIFDDFAMIKPFLDTVPGKATAAGVWDPNSAKIAQADGELAGPLRRGSHDRFWRSANARLAFRQLSEGSAENICSSRALLRPTRSDP